MTDQKTSDLETKSTPPKKSEARKNKEYEANRKALEELCTLYPEVFNLQQPKPLQIGIHETIAADGKLSKTRIRRALNLYVRSRRYIACLTEGAERITLNSEVTGQVTAEEAQHSAAKLAEIDKKRAARKPKPKAPRTAQKKGNSARSENTKRQHRNKQPSQAPDNKVANEQSSEERMQSKLEALLSKHNR